MTTKASMAKQDKEYAEGWGVDITAKPTKKTGEDEFTDAAIEHGLEEGGEVKVAVNDLDKPITAMKSYNGRLQTVVPDLDEPITAMHREGNRLVRDGEDKPKEQKQKPAK